MNYSILEALLIPEIATEADDITKQVNAAMGGKKSKTEKLTNDQREEDLTKVNNIFDDISADDNNPQDNPVNTNDNQPAPQNADQGEEAPVDTDSSNDQNPNSDDPNAMNDNPDGPLDTTDTSGELGGDENAPQGDGSDDMNGGAPGADDMPGDPNASDPSMGDDSGMGEDDPGMSPEDQSIFSDKNTLKKNMIYFFNIIRYNISNLEASLGATEDQEALRVCNSVIHNLYGLKDVLYKTLTEEMESTPYETLVAKYVTAKRIYDLSCDMLEEHFSNNPNKKIRIRRFKNK